MAFAVKVQSSPCSRLRPHVVLTHGSKRNTTNHPRLSATTFNERITDLRLHHKISPSLEVGIRSRRSQGRTQVETPCKHLWTLSLNHGVHSKQHGENHHNPGASTVALSEEIRAGGHARESCCVDLFLMLQAKLQTVRQTMRRAFDLMSKLLLESRWMQALIVFCAMTSTELHYGSYDVMQGCSAQDELHSEYIKDLYAAVMVQTLISKGPAV